MRYIVAAFDPERLPRAYGLGDTVYLAQEMCRLQLAEYRRAKHQVGDPLATAIFVFKYAEVTGGDSGTWIVLE